jgi:hypothetical protein
VTLGKRNLTFCFDLPQELKKNGAIIEVGFISSHCEDGEKKCCTKSFLVLAEKGKCENELLKTNS